MSRATRFVLLLGSHLLVLAFGIALGVYFLPVLIEFILFSRWEHLLGVLQ